MIEIKKINIAFKNKECIKDGHFIACPSQITGIYGESGTGKSSLLYVLGMLSNQEYEYWFDGKKCDFDELQKAEFRNKHISFITQNSLLIETINVEKNIEFYLMQSASNFKTDELLKLVHLEDKGKAMPNSLSGGERQRVAIACALAKDSDIILGDELTASLDEDNKEIIMELLKQCANQGKTVILVSHEDNIITQCDRIYKIDHLELLIEKDSNYQNETQNKKSSNLVSPLRMFELLFNSNRKNNWRRIIISTIVMAILFLSTSIFVQAYHNLDNSEYSTDGIAKQKLTVLSDQGEEYRGASSEDFINRIIFNFEPIDSEYIEKINEIKHIDKVYDYYNFKDSLSNTGRSSNMSLNATRNGIAVERRESTAEYYIDKHDYEYSVIPIYPEEEFYDSAKDGVYINETLAYIYQLEVGDTLELELSVPYAMAKSVVAQPKYEDSDIKYNYVSTIGKTVPYQTKVAGIMPSTKSLHYCEMYMRYNIMEAMINEQVDNYKNGKNVIYTDAYDGYSTIEDLEPYAKAVFVDDYQNVLKVKNEINEMSRKIYANSEYQQVLELIEESQGIIDYSFILTCVGVVIFIVGGIIVEILYLRKYKSTYMIINLIGYDKKEAKKVYLIQALWQMMIIMFLGSIVYIVSSLPDILVSLKIATKEEVWLHINEFYNLLMSYCGFSKQHIFMFGILIILVVGIINIVIKRHYDKQDLTTWIRGG